MPLAALAGGCSESVLVVVDPDPCADGGVVGCAQPGLLDDLIGYWRLDDGADSATVRDWSGRGNNGTLVDLDPGTAWVPGRAAGGLAVEAAGFVNVVRSASIDSITQQVTVAAWMYLEGTIVEFGTAVSREIGNTVEQHYHISLSAQDRPNVFVQTELGQVVRLTTTGDPVARLTWVHVAATYDGAFVRLYVDGQEIANHALTGRFAADTTPFIIGGNGNGVPGAPTELFPGRADEIMLYRRALAAEEISLLHAGALFAASTTPADSGARD